MSITDVLFLALQAGTADRDLIRIIVTRCEVDMVQIKQEFNRLYNKSLESYISVCFDSMYNHCIITYKLLSCPAVICMFMCMDEGGNTDCVHCAYTDLGGGVGLWVVTLIAPTFGVIHQKPYACRAGSSSVIIVIDHRIN